MREHMKRAHFSFVPHVLFSVVVFTIGIVVISLFAPGVQVQSAGLDSVTVSLSSETISTEARVTVAFEVGNLSDGETVTIYLGENTGGSAWGLAGITTADMSCSDNGAGETYTAVSIDAATATLPLTAVFTATTVGAGASTVTCLIGDGAADNPSNPATADGYSVAVVTTQDSGAGIAYVGNANDVQVDAQTLPNLTLTIDNADGTACTTTGGGVTSCDLGVLTIAAVNTGSYDVNVGTNATTGATIRVQDDQDLTSGADTIADVVENNTVTANTEGYGIAVAATVNWTESVPFDDDDTPITTSAQAVATSGGPIATTDQLDITHRAAVDSTTESGNYSHVVTWTATANF